MKADEAMGPDNIPVEVWSLGEKAVDFSLCYGSIKQDIRPGSNAQRMEEES